MHAIALVVVDLRDRCVDRDLVEVGPTEARYLRVDVGVNTAREQRIVAEVDTGDDVRGAERDLLRLGEEVVRISIEHHSTDRRERNQLLRNDLGRVEHIEAVLFRVTLAEHLDRELPLRIRPASIASQRSRRWKSESAPEIFTASSQPANVCRRRRPVELHEVRLALGVHESERVHAEALHHSIAARDGAIRHHPHQHVRGFRHQRNEVPERVVSGCGLRHRVMRLGFTA
jgi:hypothetical protein